jgi:hypothetical protein
VKVLTLIGLTFCLLVFPVLARGSSEPGGENERQALLLYPAGNEPEPLVRERFDLGASASAFFWSSFRVQGGRVSIDRSGAYSLPRLMSRQEGGAWAIYEYRVTVPLAESGRKRIEVAFGAEQAIAAALQPGPYAVREAIGRSGEATGSVRLLEISHTGGGRFLAVVELR